jgi:hypothetical protein
MSSLGGVEVIFFSAVLFLVSVVVFCMMSAADGGDVILTCGFVKQVVDGDLSNESFTGAIVQVLEISWSLSNNGRNRCSVTVSDGEHLMECFLAPSLDAIIPMIMRCTLASKKRLRNRLR